MSDPFWVDAGVGDSIGTATIEADDDRLTIVAHGLLDGDPVMVTTITGGAADVLFEDTIYYVRAADANSFSLAGAPGGNIIPFATDGGCDVFTAVPRFAAIEMRRAQSMFLYPTADYFGARSGVRPHDDPAVTLVGTSWTVRDINAVVYPGLTTQSGPYIVQHPSEFGSTVAADGTNDRIDALDLQIQDDSEDASGFRRGRIVYVQGTPAGSPVAPALTVNSLRLAAILVPAGGSPGPSISSLGAWTVALGGILPLQDAQSQPTAGYEGMYADQNDALLRRSATGTFEPVATSHAPEAVLFTSSGTFEKADYPWGKYAIVEVQAGGGGGGGAAATGADQGSVGGGGGGGGYSRKVISLADMSTSETVTVGTGGAGGTAGNDGIAGNDSSFGSHCSATGGLGADGTATIGQYTNAFGGDGGVGLGGDINVAGDDGGNGYVITNDGALNSALGGHGGNAHLGGGRRVPGGDVSDNGLAGHSFGGGGSGAYNGESSTGSVGGAGANGCVLVTVY